MIQRLISDVKGVSLIIIGLTLILIGTFFKIFLFVCLLAIMTVAIRKSIRAFKRRKISK